VVANGRRPQADYDHHGDRPDPDCALSSQGLKGHYGLRGMRERATLIQGKLAVWSEVDSGTEVELRLPVTSAYATARRTLWFTLRSAGKA
jgi:hypothetical protein